MENLIVKNWKKIFIVIGAIILAMLLFYKISWKPNVLEGYLNSNINVEKDVIDNIKSSSTTIQDDIRGDDDKNLSLNTKTGEVKGSRSVIGWVVIFVIVFVAIMLLDSYMSGSSSSGAKKK